MNDVTRAWDEFMRAIDEARAAAVGGAEPHAMAELVPGAHELLDLFEDEIAAHQIDIPAGAAGAVLSQLRGRLRSLERGVMPTRH